MTRLEIKISKASLFLWTQINAENAENADPGFYLRESAFICVPN